MNARYQDPTKKPGSTRRSASSAKPKREAGVGGSPAKKASSGKGVSRGPVDTPEIRRYRNYSLILLGVALAAATVLAFVPGLRENRGAVGALGGVWLGAFGGAVYIDWVLVRRLRKEAAAGGGAKKAVPEKVEKQDDSGTGGGS